MNIKKENNIDHALTINVCRCCLAEGCYKDITNEYYYSGQKEVYGEMLQNVFNIQISYQMCVGPSTTSRLICEECIIKLRDAKNFKDMILQSEKCFTEFIQGVQPNVNTEKVNNIDLMPEDDDIKFEPEYNSEPEINEDVECFELDNVNQCVGTDDNETIKEIKKDINELLLETEQESKKRKSEENGETKKRLKVSNGHKKSQKKIKLSAGSNQIAESRIYASMMRKNSLNLIANSTLCVFQWDKSWYRCFICKEAFPAISELREHSEEHTLNEIEDKMKNQQNRMVKAEVSELFCKICKKEMQHLSRLREHLTDAHKIKFDNQEHLLVPFKIHNTQHLQCQLCEEPFGNFRHLNVHMNKHYRNHVCHICGSTFSNLVFLNLHKTRSHRSWHCKKCDVTFTTKAERNQHDVAVHKVKLERRLRFPCPYCQERFSQENFRAKHAVEKHGVPRPDYKCDYCAKSFITRSLCNNHMKNVHQKEKNHECDICHHLFYTKSDVARHRVTHTREKKFICETCNSLFATKDSLRRHMKRTHVTQ